MNSCRLCNSIVKLQDSHIIPKFIGKWIKKTSATGYLRSIDKPNLRRQDIFTIKLLCKKCEDIFSDHETYFAEKIFHPYMNRDNFSYNYSYNDQLSRFCASVSWRVLVYITEHLNKVKNAELEKAKMQLQLFLLNKSDNLYQYEQHIIPLEGGGDSPLHKKHSNVNSYFTRAIDTDIISTKNGILIYTKLPNFIVISNVNHNEIAKSRSSRVALKQGNIIPKEYVLPIDMYYYLDNRLKFIKENITDKISESQNKHMLETIEKDLERFKKSRSLKAIEDDLFPNISIFSNKSKPY